MFHDELFSKKRRLLVFQTSVKERKMQSLHFLLFKGLTPPTLFSAFFDLPLNFLDLVSPHSV